MRCAVRRSVFIRAFERKGTCPSRGGRAQGVGLSRDCGQGGPPGLPITARERGATLPETAEAEGA